MVDKKTIESFAREHGFPDFRWISGNDVRVCHWVRSKCMFGCNSFGRKAACPPNVPSVSDCRHLFREYEHILIIEIRAKVDTDHLEEWSRKINLALLPLERQAFLAGYHKAFVLFMDECRLCEECTMRREDCRNPAMARPCPEALGVDVFSTVRSAGFQIDVVAEYTRDFKKYSFLLVE